MAIQWPGPVAEARCWRIDTREINTGKTFHDHGRNLEFESAAPPADPAVNPNVLHGSIPRSTKRWNTSQRGRGKDRELGRYYINWKNNDESGIRTHALSDQIHWTEVVLVSLVWRLRPLGHLTDGVNMG